MHLEPFSTDHVEQLKDWSLAQITGNKFIDFYLDPYKWLKLVDNKRRFAFAVIRADELVGFIDMEFVTEDSVGIAFGLSPQHRGQGQGKELLGLLETFAKDHNAKLLLASVENDNTACKHLLTQSGFHQTNNDGELTSFIKHI